jgi:tetratricopeptide (TPR) repeat protein
VPTEGHAPTRARLVVAAALALAVVLVFGRTATFDFADYDDREYVVENPHLARGLTPAGIAWAFTATHASNYHPLTWLSHMADVAVWGLDHPGGHHLTNVLLHLLNSWLLFALLLRMTQATWRSALVAALFAVHPLHVESVAWIAERKDVLSTAFALAAMHAWVGYARRPGPGRYALVALLMACGLLAKPMVVTLPIVLLLFDHWPLGRTRHVPLTRLAAEKVPLLLLAAASAWATIMAAKPQAMSSIDRIGLGDRLANAAVSYAWYLAKAVWPSDLCVLYPHPTTAGAAPLAAWQVAGSLLLLAAVSALVWRHAAARFPVTGWLWFLAGIVPVSGIAQAGVQAHADRYTYLSLTGIFVLVVWGAARWLEARPQRAAWRRVAVGAAVTALVALGARAHQQVGVWRDAATLYRHALSILPSNILMHFNLGAVYEAQGRLADAERHYRAALGIKPDHAASLAALGHLAGNRGEPTDAVALYRLALRADPRHPTANALLAETLMTLGERDEAIERYRAALRLDPANSHAHTNLATLLAETGDAASAIRHYERALALAPDSAGTHNNLAIALEGRGDLAGAVRHYRAALAIDPDYADAHMNLATALEDQGHVDDGLAHLRTAIRLAPADAHVHYTLGGMLLRHGRRAAGLEALREAMRLAPEWVNPVNLAAWTLATTPGASAAATQADAAQAVVLAERARALRDDPWVVTSVAAAYAAAGRTDDALALTAGLRAAAERDADLATLLGAMEDAFRAGDAYRVP